MDTVVFLALMSGPPKFRFRDITASLTGQIDSVVLLHVCVWCAGGLWVLARVGPSLLRRGILPRLNPVQVFGALFIFALSLSIWISSGFLLTGFVLGQLAVMLGFSWVFVHRFGTAACLLHLFGGVCLLTLALLIAALLAPDLMIAASQMRFRGEQIVPTGAGTVAAMGLVFCLSNIPRLRSTIFWGAVVVFGGLLVWSRMRTAYVALLAYFVIGSMFGRGLRVRPLVGVLVAVSVGLFLIEAFAPAASYVVRETQTIENMNNRVPLWTFLTEEVMRDEPVIGLGYFAASRVLGPKYNEGLGTAHSVFFEVLVGGGLVGAVAYLLFCALLLWYASRLLRAAPGQPQTIVTVGLLAFCLVVGITSTEAAHSGPVGFTFWCMTALLPAMCREAECEAVLRAPRVRPHGITSPTLGTVVR